MMQKFAFILFALSAALLGLAAPVQDAAIMERETNAQRFARGMPPMAPVRRSETEKRDGPHPSKRPGDHYARTPSEKRDGPHPSKKPGDHYARTPSVKRDGPHPSKKPGDHYARSPSVKRDGPHPSKKPGDHY